MWSRVRFLAYSTVVSVFMMKAQSEDCLHAFDESLSFHPGPL
jgi:hypothetical protein